MAGFDQIIGHTDVVEHLKNAMKMDKVSHAYIFNGEKGCGKKTLAREFARALRVRETGKSRVECVSHAVRQRDITSRIL